MIDVPCHTGRAEGTLSHRRPQPATRNAASAPPACAGSRKDAIVAAYLRRFIDETLRPAVVQLARKDLDARARLRAMLLGEPTSRPTGWCADARSTTPPSRPREPRPRRRNWLSSTNGSSPRWVIFGDLAAPEESPVLVEVVAFAGEQPVGGTASGVPSAKPRGADGSSLGPKGSAARCHRPGRVRPVKRRPAP